MTNERNILDQAAKALSESTIPKGPSDDLIRKTLEKIEKEQTTIPFMERMHKMKSISKFAAAAIVIIGVSVVFLFNQNPSNIAWADVVKAINEVNCVCMTADGELRGSKVNGTTWFDFENQVLISKQIKDGVVIAVKFDGKNKIVENYDPSSGRVTTSALDEKLAQAVMPQKDFLTYLLKMFALTQPDDAIANLDNWQRKLGPDDSNTVFELSTIWGGIDSHFVIKVDSKTQRPVELNMEIKDTSYGGQIHATFEYPEKIPSSFGELRIEIETDPEPTQLEPVQP